VFVVPPSPLFYHHGVHVVITGVTECELLSAAVGVDMSSILDLEEDVDGGDGSPSMKTKRTGKKTRRKSSFL